MNLLDDRGVSWKVEAGDAASKHVNVLRKRGFDLVVLPRAAYLTGTLPDVMIDRREDDFVHWVRLQDCVAVLRGEA